MIFSAIYVAKRLGRI